MKPKKSSVCSGPVIDKNLFLWYDHIRATGSYAEKS